MIIEQEIRVFDAYTTQDYTSASCAIPKFAGVLFDVRRAPVAKGKDGGSLDMIDLYLFGKVCWDTDWCCACMRMLFARGEVAMCNGCNQRGWYLIAGSL